MITFIYLSFLRIVGLIKKELLTVLMDPNSRVILIAPVIVQCILFGYGVSYHLEHVPIAIYSESKDNVSYELIREILNTPRFELTDNCHSVKCLQDSIDSEKSLIALYLASDFKYRHQVNVITDARNTASANTALSYVSSIVDKVNQRIFGKSAISLNSRFLFNENNYTRYTILVGMSLALSVIQVLLLSALSVSREKEEGTYDMMIMTPARPVEMLLGKAIPPIIIATVQSLILVAISYFYFDIPMRGSIVSIFLLIVIFSFGIVGLGLAISTICKTTMQSLISAFCLCLILIMSSGLITAADGMPKWFLTVTYVNPLYYGVNAMWQLYLQGKSFFEVIYLLLPLCGVGVVSMSIASYLFRNKLD